MNRQQGLGQTLRNVTNMSNQQTSQQRSTAPSSRIIASKSGAWGSATTPGPQTPSQTTAASESWAQAMNSRPNAQLDLSSSSFPSLAAGSSQSQNPSAASSQWQAGPPPREQTQPSQNSRLIQRQQPLSSNRDGMFSADAFSRNDFSSLDQSTRRSSMAPGDRFQSENHLPRGGPPGLVPRTQNQLSDSMSSHPSRGNSPVGPPPGIISARSPTSQGLNGSIGQERPNGDVQNQQSPRQIQPFQGLIKDPFSAREPLSPNGIQEQSRESIFRGMSEHDKWGLAGWQALHDGPNAELRALSRGQDLATFGLNTEPGTSLLRSYAGPFAPLNAFPPRPLDTDFTIPDCYIVQNVAPIQQRISGFTEDTLFYIFYTSPKDIIQEEVATELMSRKWRFHMKEKMWLTRDDTTANPVILEKDVCEQGYYIWWDWRNWKRARRAYTLRYEDLDDHLSGGRSLAMPGLFQGGFGLMAGMNGGGGTATGGNVFNAVPGLERMVALGRGF